MGLLDNNKVQASIVINDTRRTKALLSTEDFDIRTFPRAFNSEKVYLVAFDGDLAVFAKDANKLYISTTGIDGDLSDVINFNSTNFPGLIDGSRINHVAIIRYQRLTSTGTRRYGGRDYRINVFTSKGQIYHNFPARANGYDGVAQDGDIYRWEESCIWDLPSRKTPVKTESVDDATLIATGCYKYIPCLANVAYEMHPVLNTDNSFVDTYGNGGFGSTYTCKDENNNTVKRPRMFTFYRDDERAVYTQTLSGLYQDQQVSVFATYQPNQDGPYGTRMCVFATTDGGRQWFVQYELGANGEILGKTQNEDSVVHSAWTNFSTFNDDALIMSFSGADCPSGTFNIKKRSQYAPNAYNKEPEKTAKFKYASAIAVSSISSTASGILVTTAASHNLSNGDIIVFEKIDSGNSTWNWIASESHTAMSAGNGTIWKARVASSTTFYLELEVHNPDNNLAARHIHTANRCKDGYIIGCGEQYPYGWIFWWPIPYGDTFDTNLDAANVHKFVRLTSTDESVYRILGMQLYDDADNTFLAGLDHCLIPRDNVAMPDGRTDTFSRNSSGVFKGKLTQIDDFSSLECVFETQQPAYFFKEIEGICIFVGMQGILGVSKDRGKTWVKYQLPDILSYSACVLIGRSSDKTIGITYYNPGYDTILIKCKV